MVVGKVTPPAVLTVIVGVMVPAAVVVTTTVQRAGAVAVDVGIVHVVTEPEDVERVPVVAKFTAGLAGNVTRTVTARSVVAVFPRERVKVVVAPTATAALVLENDAVAVYVVPMRKVAVGVVGKLTPALAVVIVAVTMPVVPPAVIPTVQVELIADPAAIVHVATEPAVVMAELVPAAKVTVAELVKVKVTVMMT